MENLIKYVIGYSPEFIENGCDEYFSYIDIAIEFETVLFDKLGLNSEPDKWGYIHNELGSFYFDGNCCWFWAISGKSTRSFKYDKIGKFYLTDGETASRIPTRKKIWREFKKAIIPKLDKALKKFAIENELDYKVSKEFKEQENYINDKCY